MEIMNMNLMDGDKEPVELYISCRGLTNLDFMGKSDPQVKVFLQIQDKWMSVGKTEKAKNNLNPDFKKTVLVDFVFETRQPLRFDVYDVDDAGDQLIGNVETSMGEIMGARKQTITLDVQKAGKTTGKITIRGDKIGGPRNDMVWQWRGLNIMNMGGCFGAKSSPQLKFFKDKGGSWLPIHETEAVKHDLNPIWKPFRISEVKLCGGDHNQVVRIECWDKVKDGQPKCIGVCDITVEKLKGGQTSFTLINEKKSKISGTLQTMEFGFQPPKPTFLDYIRGGEQLNLMVGIDFTLSNLRPNDPNSLHAWLPNGQMNDYQQAICTVCQILLNYDFDKFVPVYGFGADLKYPTLPPGDSDCFPCNGNLQQPHVPGLQGIMDAYNFALHNILLSGPTIFGKVIAEAMKVAKANKENGSDIYTILLILTDGRMNDIRQVVQLLIDAAKLPLSIIIVGLGDSDFSNMDMVSDRKKLEDQAGSKVERDLVNFVLYRKHKNNMPELAKHLLAEVPKQLVKYKELVNQNPKPSFY